MEQLEWLTSQPATAVIVKLKRPRPHWTVVKEVVPEGLSLCDSNVELDGSLGPQASALSSLHERRWLSSVFNASAEYSLPARRTLPNLPSSLDGV
jgi:hypothetical protein